MRKPSDPTNDARRFARPSAFQRSGASVIQREQLAPCYAYVILNWIAAMSARPSVKKVANDGSYYIARYEGYAGEVMAA